VDGIRVGRSIRALRIRRGWRQADLATASDVARSVISRIELGAIGSTHLQAIEAVCGALGADLDVRVRWHGEGLDRLLDQAHAALVERFVDLLRDSGWEVAVEATFNVYGERGSVDVLGWFAATRSLLIAEIKSVVADAQWTLAPLDRKVRHGGRIGHGRGWEPVAVSQVLVVRDGSTNRRRIADLAATFEAALPARGTEFRRWLRAPSGSLSALIFLPDAPQKGTRRTGGSWQRVNRPRSRRGRAE
jgi:transcriptional regulator with XRE-family HTH domain